MSNTKDKNQLHIYCSDELRAMIEEMAIANDRTVTAQIRVLIATAYADHKEQTINVPKGK